jgi:hypothetical protein
MVNTRGIARLGTLAVGLGIGAAWAHTPVASADSTDWLSSIDSLLGGAVPAISSPSGLDLAISFDGTSLFQSGDATATSGTGDFAIAYGADSTANAEGGTGDYALADGTNALANAGSFTGTGDNFDSAVDIGNNTKDAATTGAPDGAYAGGGSLIGGTDSATNSNDTAIDIGNNGVSTDTSFPGDGGNTGAFAGDGQLIGASGAGNGDTAINLGNDNGFGDGPAAVAGTGDSATTSGDETGTNIGALAGFGNNDIASVIGGTSSADAGGEYGTTILGNNDIATVFDPTGALGSTADAGANSLDPGNFDLASVFGDGLNATAQGANFLFDILPSL